MHSLRNVRVAINDSCMYFLKSQLSIYCLYIFQHTVEGYIKQPKYLWENKNVLLKLLIITPTHLGFCLCIYVYIYNIYVYIYIYIFVIYLRAPFHASWCAYYVEVILILLWMQLHERWKPDICSWCWSYSVRYRKLLQAAFPLKE